MHCENYLPTVTLSSLSSLTPVWPCCVQAEQLPALWISAIHPPAMTGTIFLKSKYHLVILSGPQVHSPTGLLLYPKVTISGSQSELCSLIHPNLSAFLLPGAGPIPCTLDGKLLFIFQLFRSSLEITSSKNPNSGLANLSKFSLYFFHFSAHCFIM